MDKDIIIEYLPIISAVFTTFLAFFVLLKNPGKKLHQLFFANCVAFAIWFASSFMMFQAISDTSIIWWDRMVYVGVVFVPILMFHFGLVFIGADKQIRTNWMLRAGYILSAIFLILSRTDYFIAGIYRYQWGVHTSAQVFHHLFLVYFAIYILMFLWQIISYYYNLQKSIKRLQAGYVVLAFILLILIGSTAYLSAYHISLFPFAYLGGVIFSSCVGWAIIHYRFMGIKFVLRKSSSIFISMVVILLFFNLISEQAVFLSKYLFLSEKALLFLTVIFLVVIFQPLRNFIQRPLDRLFFTDAAKYERVWAKLSQGQFEKMELPDIVNNLVLELKHLYDFRGIDVFLQSIDNNYELAFSDINKSDHNLIVLQKLIDYLSNQQDVLIKDELEFLLTSVDDNQALIVLEIMRRYNYNIAIPLLVETKLVGVVFANGYKKIIKLEDVKLLKEIARRTGLAIGQVVLYQQALSILKKSVNHQIVKV